MGIVPSQAPERTDASAHEQGALPPNRGAAATTEQPRPYAEGGFYDSAAAYLTAEGEPRTAQEIAEALLAGGYPPRHARRTSGQPCEPCCTGASPRRLTPSTRPKTAVAGMFASAELLHDAGLVALDRLHRPLPRRRPDGDGVVSSRLSDRAERLLLRIATNKAAGDATRPAARTCSLVQVRAALRAVRRADERLRNG